jgi:hypothetical protein
LRRRGEHPLAHSRARFDVLPAHAEATAVVLTCALLLKPPPAGAKLTVAV